jgi:hypothetical protein
MALPQIPVVDIRDGGVVRHAHDSAATARALREECLAFFPRAAHPFIPLLDRIARRWLTRSRSPYVGEIEAIAAALGFPGIWFLNGSYQWGCTTLAHEEGGSPWLTRTLDWPFPGLGRHAEVAHMRGPAGEFFSVNWPGYVGVLTAMAPGRFAAAINQAPMWRRTLRPWLRPYDMAANAIRTWSIRHVPPDQLLREVFETCSNFEQARAKLETTPVARPVIFTLVGAAPGETCVIERTEEKFSTRFDDTSVANDWRESHAGWEGRIAGDLMFTCSFDGAAENSRARRTALAGWAGKLPQAAFEWVTPPVLNPYTRLAVIMCPSAGTLRVLGFERVGDDKLPRAVTQVRAVSAPTVMPA